MKDDADRIIAAINKSAEESKKLFDATHARLDDHETRIRAMETAITVQGLKVGAILVLIITVAGSIGSLFVNKIDMLAKWWSSQ
jgi:hypothetical protein